ncbi:MAG: hypothetical protein F6J93_40120 [Oscillatoria sp. SIO1A7]|nr:hypothetical protein [Oscillatoria sp. SIO1A7]
MDLHVLLEVILFALTLIGFCGTVLGVVFAWLKGLEIRFQRIEASKKRLQSQILHVSKFLEEKTDFDGLPNENY